MLANALKEKEFDLRLQEKFLREKKMSPEELKKYLESLEDMAEKSESMKIEVPQPPVF
jgi:tripartite-type tricarboxylate transporter receptor subunit TctC